MPLFVTVTPGTTVTSSTTLDASTLNLLGTPSVDVTGTVDGGSVSITSGSVPLASLVAQANATIVGNGSGSSNSPVALNASADFAFTPTTMAINTNAVTTAKIANSNVTYAKIQDVSNDNRLLGRAGGGVNVAELTVGSGLTLSGGALTNGLLRYTTSLKDIPVLGSGARNLQWLESLGELPSITVVPQIVKVVLRCKTQQLPFEVGYEIPIESVSIQGFFTSGNQPVFSYQPNVNIGLVGGTDAFVNVWFATQYPGNPTNANWGTIPSQLVVLTNTGSWFIIDTAKWQVKAYLLYASTWA
jgi:Repeat of unknown function (DUF5907)